MEEGGLALSFTRQSFFHSRGRGNLATHDFLEMSRAFAGEFDFLVDLSGGPIVVIRCQSGLFFLQSHDVHIAKRLELLDHLEIDLVLFLKVLSMIFFRVAEVHQWRTEHLRDSVFVISAFCYEFFELRLQLCLCLAIRDILQRALDATFEGVEIVVKGLVVRCNGLFSLGFHVVLSL